MATERKVTVITLEDFEGVSHEQVADFLVRGELARIEGQREEFGDQRWAENVGEALITQLTLLQFERDPQNYGVAEIAKRLIAALTPMLLEIYTRPELGHSVAVGMTEELASRGLLPDVDVNELLSARWDPKFKEE